MGHCARRLPHWELVGQPLFVTFRLHGSLPAPRVFPPARMTSGQAFVALDRLLDQPGCGPAFLQRPEIARLVMQALHDGQFRFHRYQLHAFVVMPNHVHLLVSPGVPSRQWLGPLKGFTGHQANRILGRHGPFWQGESYDHLIRDDQEFRRVQRCIEHNPVRAGLVALPEQHAWSSASAAPGRPERPERTRTGGSASGKPGGRLKARPHLDSTHLPRKCRNSRGRSSWSASGRSFDCSRGTMLIYVP